MDSSITKVLSSRSASCAEAVLSFLAKYPEGIGTPELNHHIKSLGFGDIASSNAKKHLLSCGLISRTGKTGLPWMWYSAESMPIPSTGQTERNNKSLSDIYEYLPWRSNFVDGWFVYAFKRDRDGIVKIGITSNLYDRAKAITYGCGSTITLCSYLDCNSRDYALELESKIHNLFDKRNIIGEWFDIVADKLPSIAELVEAMNEI
jgi:hypothetical protein